MNHSALRCLRFLAGLAAFVWVLVMVIVWSLADLLRWHPCQTLAIIAAFCGTLALGLWLSLE